VTTWLKTPPDLWHAISKIVQEDPQREPPSKRYLFKCGRQAWVDTNPQSMPQVGENVCPVCKGAG
jgi:hypothetical protein